MVGLDLRVHTNTLAGYCIPTLSLRSYDDESNYDNRFNTSCKRAERMMNTSTDQYDLNLNCEMVKCE
jgi:hypothetical protein